MTEFAERAAKDPCSSVESRATIHYDPGHKSAPRACDAGAMAQGEVSSMSGTSIAAREQARDFNGIARRTSVWHGAAQYIDAERQATAQPVEGSDAAWAIRLAEVCGDVMAAVNRGHRDVGDELARVIACATAWSEGLGR